MSIDQMSIYRKLKATNQEYRLGRITSSSLSNKKLRVPDAPVDNSSAYVAYNLAMTILEHSLSLEDRLS
jgi:hypothetical protein